MRSQQQQAEIAEATHDDLRWADGIAWGTPTRYGNMSAQMKAFIDTTGALWVKGELEDKATGMFVSTATIHGGHETTIVTGLVPRSQRRDSGCSPLLTRGPWPSTVR